jgi:hypothetical protein
MEAAWVGLLGTAIGGAIGLLGPWLLQRRREAEENRQRRAAKFEELVAAIYEFDHWGKILGTSLPTAKAAYR